MSEGVSFWSQKGRRWRKWTQSPPQVSPFPERTERGFFASSIQRKGVRGIDDLPEMHIFPRHDQTPRPRGGREVHMWNKFPAPCRAPVRVLTIQIFLARPTLNSFGKRLIEWVHNSFLVSLYSARLPVGQILTRSTPNSFEKRLIEPILQLSTPESLAL